jgi:hypothetical protein
MVTPPRSRPPKRTGLINPASSLSRRAYIQCVGWIEWLAGDALGRNLVGAENGADRGSRTLLSIAWKASDLARKQLWVVDNQGNSVWVLVKQHPQSGRWFLTTESDGRPLNNLANLREC